MTTPRHRQSSGQTLPLLALFMPAMLALMALGLDGAQLFLERRDAQSAADLAALAGVRSLPDAPTTATADATAIGVAHGYSESQVAPVTPYNGNATYIEVTVNSSVDTFFMGIFGVSKMDVNARAVAKAETSAASASTEGYAIFALEHGCNLEKSVDVSGADSFFVGRIHSNSDVYFGGGGNTIDGPTTYQSSCGFHNGDSSNDFDPSPTSAPERPNPIDATYDWDYFCPITEEGAGKGYNGPTNGDDWDLSSDGDWWFGGTKDPDKLLNPGIYCSTNLIKLGDSDVAMADVNGTQGITFLSKTSIDISGSNFQLEPFLPSTTYPNAPELLLASWGTGDDAIDASGSGGSWSGIIYSPTGEAELSGQNNGQDEFDLTGGIIGNRVKLNGSNATINGTVGAEPATVGEQTISLVE